MNLGLAKFYDHAPRNKRGIKEKGKKNSLLLYLYFASSSGGLSTLIRQQQI